MKIRLICLLMLVLFSRLSAACQTDPSQPVIPSGSRANYKEMLAAQVEVNRYLTAATERLKCIYVVRSYNALVDEMNKTADAFNNELRIFRSRSDLPLQSYNMYQ